VILCNVSLRKNWTWWKCVENIVDITFFKVKVHDQKENQIKNSRKKYTHKKKEFWFKLYKTNFKHINKSTSFYKLTWNANPCKIYKNIYTKIWIYANKIWNQANLWQFMQIHVNSYKFILNHEKSKEITCFQIDSY
jgi:hypothetical protein